MVKNSSIPPLSTLYCYLTEGCNLACRHCWLKPKFDPQGTKFPHLPAALFADVVAEAKPLGLQAVKLTGGEPLLNPEIHDFLRTVREQELDLVIETNGLLCTPELAQEISRCSNPFVSVSIDGADAATHEGVRGVKGSFAPACAAVRNLAAVGLRPQIIFSVMRENVHQIENLIHLGEDLGVASIKFNIIQPTARGKKMHEEDAALSIPELIALNRRLEDELASTTTVKLLFDIPEAFQPLSQIASGTGHCGIMNILGLLPTGHYALCGIGEQISELVFGKAGEDDLATIWSSHPTLMRLRQDVPNRLDGVCGKCLMRKSCLGSCIAQNYYRKQSLNAPFWFCEYADDLGLFPKSRKAE
jgi:SynChlorMet cassette radical SAM/SPASM protein ScmF